jgi:hypothetical protein
MAQQNPDFDGNLRGALKRTPLAEGASPQLRAKMTSLVRDGAPSAAPAPSGLNNPRVFGLPRVWGLAAAVAMLLIGGGLIAYQVQDWFPAQQVAYADPKETMIKGLSKVHQSTPDPVEATADLHDFQQKLPSAMPVAAIYDSNAKLLSASFEDLNGRICYAVRYLVDGKTFTLVTANARIYYEIPDYNQVEGSLRLVGGEREGYLVCLIGEKGVPEPRYQSLLASVKMLPSPSTQPVSSAASADGCALH